MNNHPSEDEIFEVFIPYIGKHCKGKWYNLEPEDRVSEAKLFFLYALRTQPVGNGDFWPNYCSALKPYMDQLNRTEPPRGFGRMLSLDCPLNSINTTGRWTLYSRLACSDLVDSRLSVRTFLSTLDKNDLHIILDLLHGCSRTSVAKKNGMTRYQLETHLQTLGQAYLKQ